MRFCFCTGRGRIRRWTLPAALACAVLITDAGGGWADARAVALGATPTGNYLAARHAEIARREADAARFLAAALAARPDDPTLLKQAYTAMALSGNVDEAVALAKRVWESDPRATSAALIVAVDAIGEQRYDDAIAILERHAEHRNAGDAGEDDIVDVLTPILLAWSDDGAGRTDRALERLSITDAGPRGVDMLYRLHAAWINDRAGRGAEAVALLDAVIAEHEEPWYRLAALAGAAYRRADRPDRAAAVYDAYQRTHPGSRLLDPAMAALNDRMPAAAPIATAADGVAEAMFDAAGLFARQNERPTAQLLGRLGLHLRPDFPALQIVVAEVIERGGGFEEANALFAAVDARAPLAWTARLGMARTLERLERIDEAVSLLRALAAERADDPSPLIELGDVFRRQERYREAIDAYDEAVARAGSLQPEHWGLLYARGIALEREKQWPRAEADFLKALEFEPEQPYVLNYLGYSWVDQGRNLGEAETMIRKAVELRPNDGYIVDSLGWVLYRLGRYEEAVVELERATELRPEDPVINDHLGDAYWSVGRHREARYQWQAALDLDPDEELRPQIKEKLAHGLIRQANAAAP